jgi:hypothetical protein
LLIRNKLLYQTEDNLPSIFIKRKSSIMDETDVEVDEYEGSGPPEHLIMDEGDELELQVDEDEGSGPHAESPPDPDGGGTFR